MAVHVFDEITIKRALWEYDMHDKIIAIYSFIREVNARGLIGSWKQETANLCQFRLTKISSEIKQIYMIKGVMYYKMHIWFWCTLSIKIVNRFAKRDRVCFQ